MKIQCQSCQAKYAIADEKVRGKVVKVRCKKCSATIIVNNQSAGDRSASSAEFAALSEVAASAQVELWTVNVADGDQRTMTVAEIASARATGLIGDETYCWKEGMTDWVMLRDSEPLSSALREAAAGRSLLPESSESALSIAPLNMPSEGTYPTADGGVPTAPQNSLGQPGFLAAAAAGSSGNVGGPVDSNFATRDAYASGVGTAQDDETLAALHAPEHAAARRGGGRGQGTDLFASAATAGSDDDIMTSANAGAAAVAMSAAATSNPRLTGQRNENSVLFSLAALTEGASPSAGRPGARDSVQPEGSGLIDLRALSAAMTPNTGEPRRSSTRIEDIMNLGGGGAFGTPLAAPVLAPPPLDIFSGNSSFGGGASASAAGAAGAAPWSGPAQPPPTQSRKRLWLGVVGVAAVAAVGMFVVFSGKSDQPSKESTPPDAVQGQHAGPVPGATSSDDPARASSPAVAGGTSGAKQPAAPGSPAIAPGTAPAAQSPAVRGAAPATPPANRPTVPPSQPTAAEKPAEAAPTPPKPVEPPKDLSTLIGGSVSPKGSEGATPATQAPASTAPFNRGAAAEALSAVTAALQSCKRPDGPTGPGHALITFAPDGSVSTAVVDSEPFAGTSVGACVASKFRGARVPAFSGGPVVVGKGFTVN